MRFAGTPMLFALALLAVAVAAAARMDAGSAVRHTTSVAPDVHTAASMDKTLDAAAYKRDVSQRAKRGMDTCTPATCKHGTCTSNVTCTCSDANYNGLNCQWPQQAAELGVVYAGMLAPDAWQYYEIAAPAAAEFELQVVMVRTSAHGDPDVYLRHGEAPVENAFDEADTTVGHEHVVTVSGEDLQHNGKYYVGVHNWAYSQPAPTNYTIVFRVHECPSGCSGHGTCHVATHTCACADGYTSRTCEWEEFTLQPGTSHRGFVSLHEWVFAEIKVPGAEGGVPAESEMRILMTSDTEDGDADLYVRFGDTPSASESDFRDLSVSRNHDISVSKWSDPALQAGTYFVGVYGFSASEFTISVDFHECLADCSGNGRCVAGECQCADGYTHTDCSVRRHPLESGKTAVHQRLGAGEWIYYEIDVTPEAYRSGTLEMEVNVHADMHADGFTSPRIHVAKDRIPSREDYDFSSPANAYNRDLATVRLCNFVLETGRYYIGVYNGAHVAATTRTTATFSGTCPGGCTRSEQGTCHSEHGVCLCQAGWQGGDCDCRDCSTDPHTRDNGECDKKGVSPGIMVLISFFMVLAGVGTKLLVDRLRGGSKRQQSALTEELDRAGAYGQME